MWYVICEYDIYMIEEEMIEDPCLLQQSYLKSSDNRENRKLREKLNIANSLRGNNKWWAVWFLHLVYLNEKLIILLNAMTHCAS